MITTHMIEASAMGLTDRLPAYAHLWNATFATAVRNAFGAVSFTYFETREAAIADAAAWGSGAAEVVPATRRLRNQAEIDRLTADAEE